MKLLIITILSLGSSLLRAQSLTLYFDFDKQGLTTSAKARLDSFLQAEKVNFPLQKIELRGHCDAIGSDAYNDQLSQKRVNTVKNYLLAHNIQVGNFALIKAYGKRQPLNENKTEEERQANRRVIIQVNQLPDISLKEKIADSSTKAGTHIVLKNINFIGGMHRILPESDSILLDLLSVMKTYPGLVIEIQGHVCCVADENDGTDLETGLINLSEARAKAIKDYLVGQGIEASRLSYKGFGHSVPLYPYPEQTEEQKTANRRVEIKILSK